MLDPFCKWTTLREQEELSSIGSIRDITLIALRQLLEFKDTLGTNDHERMDIRLYELPPRFNMIFIDSRHLLLQTYASFTRGRDNPCFYIRREMSNSIFDFYYEIFQKTYDVSKNISLDMLR